MLKPVSSFWQKIERRLARYRECRTVNFISDRGIVCFTFDDVQRSACDQGVEILNKYGVNGTFYISGGLTGTRNYHTEADLLRLVGTGHELGSHGFVHLGYQSIGKGEILSDIESNRVFFEKLGIDAPQNFAYPYGHVSPFVKRVLACKFVSLRGIGPGINYPTADLALLKATPLYQHLWTKAALVKMIEDNAKLCGLLIFFAHGVVANPEVFDCSIDFLDFAVRTSIASGNRVTTLRDALLPEPRPDDVRVNKMNDFSARLGQPPY